MGVRCLWGRNSRGTAANDVYAVGHFGEVLHRSGKTWRSYQSEVGIPGGIYRRVAAKGPLVIVAGTDPPWGAILVGRRTM
jgi:hypothetical protein